MPLTAIESLFLRTIEDLEARAKHSDAYEILGASALIRKLLIDEHPLVDQVNQKHREKLVFQITDSGPPGPGLPQPVFWSIQDGLDPETCPPGPPRKFVKRDQLLSTVLAVVNGHPYTLREIVLFEANVMGGVHAGAAREKKEEALEAVNKVLLWAVTGRLCVNCRRSAGLYLEVLSRCVLLFWRLRHEGWPPTPN